MALIQSDKTHKLDQLKKEKKLKLEQLKKRQAEKRL